MTETHVTMCAYHCAARDQLW